MLDDLRKIHERDPSDALGSAEKQWQQLDVPVDFQVEPRQFSNMVVAGMGSSAVAADVARVWLKIAMPFEICRDYAAPAYVGPDTLFVASSYSGNSAEVLSALEQAEAVGATIVIVTAGGSLLALAAEKSYPIVQLPIDTQARYSVCAALKAMAVITDAYGITDGRAPELATAGSKLAAYSASWLPTASTAGNVAKQVALECIGKSVVVQAGLGLAPAAHRWRLGFNENAKQIAWLSVLPEANYGEFIGWTKKPEQKPYAIIELRSSLEHPQIQKSFELNARLLSGKRPAPIVVQAIGDSLLEQLLSSIMLGDFVTIYTALLSNIDPMPLTAADKRKQELARNV